MAKLKIKEVRWWDVVRSRKAQDKMKLEAKVEGLTLEMEGNF